MRWHGRRPGARLAARRRFCFIGYYSAPGYSLSSARHARYSTAIVVGARWAHAPRAGTEYHQAIQAAVRLRAGHAGGFITRDVLKDAGSMVNASGMAR